MNHIWLKEAKERLSGYVKRLTTLEEQKARILSLQKTISVEEWEFSVRNTENSIANEKYSILKLQRQIDCNHDWECLGGGGQIMTDMCRNCGASFDY
jgi:hypothetical protein